MGNRTAALTDYRKATTIYPSFALAKDGIKRVAGRGSSGGRIGNW